MFFDTPYSAATSFLLIPFSKSLSLGIFHAMFCNCIHVFQQPICLNVNSKQKTNVCVFMFCVLIVCVSEIITLTKSNVRTFKSKCKSRRIKNKHVRHEFLDRRIPIDLYDLNTYVRFECDLNSSLKDYHAHMLKCSPSFGKFLNARL